MLGQINNRSMADKRKHRGAHPEDRVWFAEDAVPILRSAVDDYSWLLTREYTYPSALKLVGDRYLLSARQRTAVMRSSCSDQAFAIRRRDQVLMQDAAGRQILLDGYNVLTTIESAIARGVLIIGRDGALRDLASMHGSWKRVEETVPAVILVGETLAQAGVLRARWLLDSPVSNSGRLKHMIEVIGKEHGWSWDVELVHDPDAQLKLSQDLVASADSAVLDVCSHWLNLARYVVRQHVERAWLIDLSDITPTATPPLMGEG